MAEASRDWRGSAPAGEEEAAEGTKASLPKSTREEWRVLGAGKSLPSTFLLGPNLHPHLAERRASGAEASPSFGAQVEDQFLHLAIRKQVSYR